MTQWRHVDGSECVTEHRVYEHGICVQHGGYVLTNDAYVAVYDAAQARGRKQAAHAIADAIDDIAHEPPKKARVWNSLDYEICADIARGYAAEQDTGRFDAPRRCPDDGRCHHFCGNTYCYRVECCGPFSGVFPDDVWPTDVVTQFGRPIPATEQDTPQ